MIITIEGSYSILFMTSGGIEMKLAVLSHSPHCQLAYPQLHLTLSRFSGAEQGLMRELVSVDKILIIANTNK